ncbi:MAG: hypothetical protein M1608_06560 [Candidatus Omnitrophica bacterium]|nr:hypothetical protein [Candidatus Omnitrophota bacterium]
MKTQTWIKGAPLTLLLGLMMLANGCASQTSSPDAASATNDAAATNTPDPAEVDVESLNRIDPVPVNTSPGVAEIIKLAQAGVDESVIVDYINSTAVAFNPSAEEIIYLNDIGLSSRVVNAMLDHDRSLRQTTEATPSTTTEAGTASAVVTNQPAGQDTATEAAAPAPQAGEVPAVGTPATAIDNYASPAPVPVDAASTAYAAYPIEPQPVTINYFYSTLSPYGSWIDLPEYGWCWQPTVEQLDPYWNPYCDRGRWLYTDSGWYWQSDYSWGWAPFHYGRWFRYPRCGWVWYPDTCWGPSWVVWRRSPLYCGWAPLPPGAWFNGVGLTFYGAGISAGFGFGLGADCFSFVSYRYFSDWNWREHRLPFHKVKSCFDQTTVINHYFRGPNHSIINEGISREHISSLSRNEIRKVNLRELPPAAAGKSVLPDRLEKDGNGLVIYRPQPQSAPPAMSALTDPKGKQGLRPQTASMAITDRPTGAALSQKQADAQASGVPGSSRQPLSNQLTPQLARPSASAPQVDNRAERGGVPITKITSAPAPTRTSSSPVSASASRRPELGKQPVSNLPTLPNLTRTPLDPRTSGPTWITTRPASSLPAGNRILTPAPSSPPEPQIFQRSSPSIQPVYQPRTSTRSTPSAISSSTRPSEPVSIPARQPSYSSFTRSSRSPRIDPPTARPSVSPVPNYPVERPQAPTVVNSAPSRSPSFPVAPVRTEQRSAPSSAFSPVQAAPVYSPPASSRGTPSPSVSIQSMTYPSGAPSRPSVSPRTVSASERTVSAPVRSAPEPARAPSPGGDQRRR